MKRAKPYQKIVVLDSVIFFPEHRKRLDALADQIVEYNTCETPEEVAERCRGADCIISCWVDIPHRVIDENPQLRTVGFWTHDYEHRIDVAFARKRGIQVPAIPDYGTDSVAELVFVALLELLGGLHGHWPRESNPIEAVVAQLSDKIRLFKKNVKDTLNGRWIHEYIKTGQRQITHSDEIPEEALKGLTVGILDKRILQKPLLQMLSNGFRMNVIYSLSDYAHDLNIAFRPVEELVSESHAIVYDDRSLTEDLRQLIHNKCRLRKVNTANLSSNRPSLSGLKLGIVGLGRIGSRVAQIASQGFNMHVQYFSRTPNPHLERELHIKYAALEEVLRSSDILTFHLPHHSAENFLSDSLINEIRPGTIFINASVGNIIENEEFLLNTFRTGRLTGYLDVYRTLPPRLALRQLRATLTPTYRLGWRTKSTVGLKTHKLLTKLEEAARPETG